MHMLLFGSREVSLFTWWVINWIVEPCSASYAKMKRKLRSNFEGLWLIKKKNLLDLCENVCLNLAICKWKYQLSLISELVFYLISEDLLKEMLSGGMLLVCVVEFEPQKCGITEEVSGFWTPRNESSAKSGWGKKGTSYRTFQWIPGIFFFLACKMKCIHGTGQSIR